MNWYLKYLNTFVFSIVFTEISSFTFPRNENAGLCCLWIKNCHRKWVDRSTKTNGIWVFISTAKRRWKNLLAGILRKHQFSLTINIIYLLFFSEKVFVLFEKGSLIQNEAIICSLSKLKIYAPAMTLEILIKIIFV